MKYCILFFFSGLEESLDWHVPNKEPMSKIKHSAFSLALVINFYLWGRNFESWQKNGCKVGRAISLFLYQIYSTPILKKKQDHSVKIEKEKLPFEVSADFS